VIHGDWLDADASHGSFDLVLGDGVLSQLSYPGDYERFCQRMRRMTRPGGRWTLRLFARSEFVEEPEKLLEEILDGRLTNINEFKLRMLMALCDAEDKDNVGVVELWRFWDRACRQTPELRNRWSSQLLVTIESYREAAQKYSFPRLNQVLDLLRKHGTIRRLRFPNYPLGQCCPMVVLEM
jgi:hypothetical protein